ncbi:hypothetical protein DICPUDRAFT_56584 [Dictyostelium purpureum]|uniref:HTH TFE/IIEalpha-type domain-containing protein n=1 Tax=Dictyostelium purpureum TaxID=5786 RepID=F0ZS84_DICPU|nr:uncharacterized protein DICPUDRAFT_56584 [Dictyostelium purpureum]EGC33203.1 hypothetical protein DICPUDRAFT_56584 [Dictyostelium purpureum]|eukprot:XP_003290285.1 hypothetical protein DICPUDRAFT_56584 [Dictyostelium purpureum]
MSTNIYHILDDLVKMVVRAFYQDDHAVVIDGLLREKKRIKDEDLARKLRINQKHVRKLLMELKGDSMVKSMDVKIEAKGPHERGQTVLLWYIDYKLIIDIVKYKFYMIRKKMESIKLQKIDIPTYRCVQCNTSFTALDVPKLLSMETGALECDVCSGSIEEDQNNESLTQTAKHQSDLLGQLKKIIDQLRKTEGANIPLFARDLADNTADQGPSYTINTNSSAGVGPKPSAFPVAQNSQMPSINPTSDNVTLDIDILDSDNIEINKTTVKVDNSKKTGLASLPPWLLPTANKRKILQQLSTNTQSTVSEQPTAIRDPLKFDSEFYINYIKNHYKEWESSQEEKEILSNPPSPSEEHIDKKIKINNFNGNNNNNNDNNNLDDILIKVGEQYKSITDVTEDDQEVMSSQEYEDYSSALYSYVSKNVFDNANSLMS